MAGLPKAGKAPFGFCSAADREDKTTVSLIVFNHSIKTVSAIFPGLGPLWAYRDLSHCSLSSPYPVLWFHSFPFVLVTSRYLENERLIALDGLLLDLQGISGAVFGTVACQVATVFLGSPMAFLRDVSKINDLALGLCISAYLLCVWPTNSIHWSAYVQSIETEAEFFIRVHSSRSGIGLTIGLLAREC